MNEDKKVYPTDKTSSAVLDRETKHDANLDPITGQPGAHPVGTGVGAAGGAVTGAALGAAVGGPVGAVVGAAVGGIAGGLAGKGVAEGINPTEEDAYWRNHYSKRPYAANRSYDDLAPAYQYGYTSAGTYTGRKFNDVEGDLQHGWEQAKGKSQLAWSDAKHATKDAWNRVAGRTENDRYWRENHTTQPYAKDRSYDDYAPAYRYGYDSASTHAGRKFDEAENDLQHGWEQAKGKSGLAWSDAKHAVKNSWHRVERALPGDADGDGY
jgi:uncharacterized protein YjbJ (UPF0337 family)